MYKILALRPASSAKEIQIQFEYGKTKNTSSQKQNDEQIKRLKDAQWALA